MNGLNWDGGGTDCGKGFIAAGESGTIDFIGEACIDVGGVDGESVFVCDKVVVARC